MIKRNFVAFAVSALGCVAGCGASASNAAEPVDTEASGASATSAVNGIAGAYANPDGARSAGGSLTSLELNADMTFSASRVARTSDGIFCVAAPCTLPIQGTWKISADGSRLYLVTGAHREGTKRYALTRATDGGPISFRDRDGQTTFTMSSVRAAPAVTLITGTFKLFEDPRATTGSCVTYTEMSISRGFAGYVAHLENRVGAFGTDRACRLFIDPRPRDYVLSYKGSSCGSTTWAGASGPGSIEITDHSTRLCEDYRLSGLDVTETTPEGTFTLFAASPPEAPPPPASTTTYEGTLTRSFGIGGENTGVSLQIGSKLVELVLTDEQRLQFVGGQLARVKGTPTTLSGVETSGREAIEASELLVCPTAGSHLNCMPPYAPGSLCAGDKLPWVEANCNVNVSF